MLLACCVRHLGVACRLVVLLRRYLMAAGEPPGDVRTQALRCDCWAVGRPACAAAVAHTTCALQCCYALTHPLIRFHAGDPGRALLDAVEDRWAGAAAVVAMAIA